MPVRKYRCFIIFPKMGLERAPYQEYQTGCGRTLLHSSVRGEFFEGKHHYPIHYVGNPTVDEVTPSAAYSETADEFKRANGLRRSSSLPLLAGSRKQEIGIICRI